MSSGVELQTAIATRARVALRLGKLQSAAAALAGERRQASDAADAAAEGLRELLGLKASGEGSDEGAIAPAKEARDTSADWLKDLCDAAAALSGKVEAVKVELAAAERRSAGARENALVVLGQAEKEQLRKLARPFAASLASLFRLAGQATEEHRLCTGQPGIEPIAISGTALQWLIEILESYGLGRDLRLLKRRDPLTEPELVDALETHECNAPPAQEETAHA